MGNLSFLIPTKKIEEFNIDNIYKTLRKNFSNLFISLDYEFSQISVYKDDELVCELFFNQNFYIYNFDLDYKYLIENNQENLAKKLKEFNELNPDLSKVIQSTHGSGLYSDIKNDVDFFIRDNFHGYIFDEGIHPEFISPDYIRKTKKKKRWF